MNRVSILVITFYQKLISPLLGRRCRYYPSCSAYSRMCFQQFSFFRALWYSSWRIIKCNPFCSGGVDFPPGERN